MDVTTSENIFPFLGRPVSQIAHSLEVPGLAEKRPSVLKGGTTEKLRTFSSYITLQEMQ